MSTVASYLQQITIPRPESHKGQNGKLLIIGGSELFHAASKWSLDVASMIVDMVFYASVPGNAELVKEAKGAFWNGIVIAEQEIPAYASEADVILIGPGMTRTSDVGDQVHRLLAQFPTKKWVIDAGALQMVEPTNLPETAIITPHQGELERVLSKLPVDKREIATLTAQGVTVLLKGQTDHIYTKNDDVMVTGGNAGMTKGGTGDVLAGLVAALYCTHPADVAAVTASLVNKKAGDQLFAEVGPYFNASQLAEQVPHTLWECVSSTATKHASK